MKKELKFQAKVTCKCNGEPYEFVSNTLTINLLDNTSPVVIKNYYTWQKFEMIQARLGLECACLSNLCCLIQRLFACFRLF